MTRKLLIQIDRDSGWTTSVSRDPREHTLIRQTMPWNGDPEHYAQQIAISDRQVPKLIRALQASLEFGRAPAPPCPICGSPDHYRVSLMPEEPCP